MRNCSDKSYRENQNTHFMSPPPFFAWELRSVYEIMWKYMVQPETPQMTNNTTHKRCDLHAGWLRQQYRRTPQNMKYFLLFHCNYCLAKAPRCLSYTYIAYLVIKYHDHMLKRASFYSVIHATVTHTPIHVVLTGKEWWRYIKMEMDTIPGFPLKQESTLPTCQYSTIPSINFKYMLLFVPDFRTQSPT
jgi:hypothetical protein